MSAVETASPSVCYLIDRQGTPVMENAPMATKSKSCRISRSSSELFGSLTGFSNP